MSNRNARYFAKTFINISSVLGNIIKILLLKGGGQCKLWLSHFYVSEMNISMFSEILRIIIKKTYYMVIF